MAPSNNGEAAKAAELVSDFVQMWLGEAQRFYEWSQQEGNTWAAADIVDQVSISGVEMFPMVARGIDFGLELLRPWSIAFQERTNNA